MMLLLLGNVSEEKQIKQKTPALQEIGADRLPIKVFPHVLTRCSKRSNSSARGAVFGRPLVRCMHFYDPTKKSLDKKINGIGAYEL